MNDDNPLAAFGWNDRFAALFSSVATVGSQPGRIMRHDRGAFLIAVREGVMHLPARRSVDALTVGDWVVVEDGAISGVLDRSSLLRRKDPAVGEQLLAANVDVVAMVFGADRPIKAGRLYRTRTQIWDAGATPLVVLTKTDLLDDADPVLARIHEIDPLLDVEAVCSFSGGGLESLRNYIAGRTLVLIGESGAGKSTLVNALIGADLASVSAVRATDHRGRHTTTARELHPLPGGGVLIDTPGLREVGLWTDESAVDAASPRSRSWRTRASSGTVRTGPSRGAPSSKRSAWAASPPSATTRGCRCGVRQRRPHGAPMNMPGARTSASSGEW